MAILLGFWNHKQWKEEMPKAEQHEIILISPLDRDETIAEIWCDKLLWAELLQSNRVYRVDFSSWPCGDVWTFNLRTVLDILSDAYSRLEFGGLPLLVGTEGFTGANSRLAAYTKCTGESAVRIFIDNQVWADLFAITEDSCTVEFYPNQESWKWMLDLPWVLSALQAGYRSLRDTSENGKYRCAEPLR